jgi:aspartyl protease family protein
MDNKFKSTLHVVSSRKRKNIFQKHKALFIVILLFAIGVALHFYASSRESLDLNAQIPISNTDENGHTQVTIKQDKHGHYIFLGTINRKQVKFILDTGATQIAVPLSIARHINLPFGRSYFANTANGRTLSYTSIAKEVGIGEIILYNIDTSIVTGYEDDKVLLGMSYLKNLEIVQKDGNIILIKK